MPAIGITGGIATGKSTFCRLIREMMPEARFFDADQAAHLLTDQDPESREAIRDAFGAEVYSAAGHLNRGKLRAIILASPSKRTVLEQILHPRIRRQWSAEARSYRNSSDFFFADIPLLYETGGETLCDRVVVVACSAAVQLRRLMQRQSAGDQVSENHRLMNENQAMEMMETQMPVQEKVRRADHVIWNNDGLPALTGQARDLVNLWREKPWKVK